MLGPDNRVLVFISFAVVVCKGVGEPIGRTDKGRFGIDVLIRGSVMASKCLRMMGRDQAEHTSARCCWPVPKVLSLTAVGVLLPAVANFGVLLETEALVDG